MRYIILVILNLPLLFIAGLDTLTQYKMKKISSRRFYQSVLLWIVILTVIIGAFPLYNLASGRSIFESSDLSTFDIVQTTVLVFLIYLIFSLRRKLEATERRLRDLHQETSIILSNRK